MENKKALRVCDETERIDGDWRHPPGEGWTWFSICSRHRNPDYDEDCPMCDTGQWVNDEAHAREHELYETDPEEWRRQANDPNSSSRKFLDKVFGVSSELANERIKQVTPKPKWKWPWQKKK